MNHVRIALAHALEHDLPASAHHVAWVELTGTTRRRTPTAEHVHSSGDLAERADLREHLGVARTLVTGTGRTTTHLGLEVVGERPVVSAGRLRGRALLAQQTASVVLPGRLRTLRGDLGDFEADAFDVVDPHGVC